MTFRVPESARMTSGPMATMPNEGLFGAFLVPSPEPGWVLVIVADGGSEPESEGWEHVSVHARNTAQSKLRVPTWKEMCRVKDLFWDVEDVVVQFHPRASKYVNQHPGVLHLWRHPARPFPEPPSVLVGTKRGEPGF